MAKYRYYTCTMHPLEHLSVPITSPAFAIPQCPDCHRYMQQAGEGNAPTPGVMNLLGAVSAPPVPVLTPLLDAEVVVVSGHGDHDRAGHLQYTLSKNEAKVDAKLEVKLDRKSTPYTVRLHPGLITGATSNSQIAAPFGNCWHTIQTKTDAMERGGVLITDPAPLPRAVKFGLKLGNAKFGLVHVMAGHFSDLRSFTSGVAQVAGMEEYRSFLAMQSGLQACLSPESLQAMYRETDRADKYVFVGLWSGKAVIVATRFDAADQRFDITTLYIGDPGKAPAPMGTRRYKTAWKRKRALLPQGW
ncbi:MAG: hypothetical protein ACRYGF_05540 [Janthinobacterium lividum]